MQMHGRSRQCGKNVDRNLMQEGLRQLDSMGCLSLSVALAYGGTREEERSRQRPEIGENTEIRRSLI